MTIPRNLSIFAQGTFASGGVSIGNTTDPGATNLSVTGTGNFGTTIGVGATTPATSGAGITFPATQSASTDVNTLDDYEEGTWTVTWTNLTGTPTNLIGTYVKIGKAVSFSYNTGATTIVGTANSTNFTLPFTPAIVSAGSLCNGALTISGSCQPYTDGKCYTTAFSSAIMIFTGVFYV